MIKKSTQKIKYLENKKRFRSEIKSISHYFKGFLIAKNCLRPESALLIRVQSTQIQEIRENYENLTIKKSVQHIFK